MSQSLLRGLSLLEAVDNAGPMTVSELAAYLGWDKGSVSRTVAACDAEGWVRRDGAKIVIGARAAVLGRTSDVAAAAHDGDQLVHTISGITGHLVQAYAYVAGSATGVASAGPGHATTPSTALTLKVRLPLWASAAGKVIAAQLDADVLARFVPPEPYPDAARHLLEFIPPAVAAQFADTLGSTRAGEPSTAVTTWPELEAQLAAIRENQVFVERGELGPSGGCVAVPWRRHGIVGALAVIATAREVMDETDHLVRILQAAAADGADRDAVVAAAAVRG